MRMLLLCAALLVIASAAHAQARVDDPDIEVARRFFDHGAQLYAAQQYEAAINEFQRAREVTAAPAFDYNIARCYDRMGDFEHALTEYRRYVAKEPADAAEVRARILLLEQRVAKHGEPATVVATEAPPPRVVRHSRTWVYAVAGVAAVVVIGAAVGIGVGLGLKPSNPSAPLGTLRW